MGHDISGYNNNGEVAYLRRGAFNDLKGTIYDVLDCHEHNGGVSGYGTEQRFNKEQITAALSKLSNHSDFDPERNFLLDCFNNTDEDGTILIHFG